MSLNMDFFEQIAIEKGCDIAFPVKEHFLIQVIQQLVSRFYSAEGELIFGGGTSLVCAYDELTKRFSEDADFRFVPRPRSTANVRKTLMDIAHTLCLISDQLRILPQKFSDLLNGQGVAAHCFNLLQCHFHSPSGVAYLYPPFVANSSSISSLVKNSGFG